MVFNKRRRNIVTLPLHVFLFELVILNRAYTNFKRMLLTVFFHRMTLFAMQMVLHRLRMI